MDDLLRQADDIATMIRIMQDQYSLMRQMNEITHKMVTQTHDLKVALDETRDSIANFDDWFRPIRNYFIGNRIA